MAEIHNTKHRMPILLNQEIQYRWLDYIPVEDFLYPNYIGKQIDFIAYQLYLTASVIYTIASYYAAKLFLEW